MSSSSYCHCCLSVVCEDGGEGNAMLIMVKAICDHNEITVHVEEHSGLYTYAET